jgi:abortive infection bacteriophage resistance protein
MRTPMGFFIPMKKTFEKPPLAIEAQLKLLSERGLIISDKEVAEHHLKFISYYRFCGYGIEFEDASIKDEKRYQQGATFNQILDSYTFDRKLRLLVIDAIERIEIAVRTVITNTLATTYGAHWYLNDKLFLKRFKHDELIQRIKKETLFLASEGTKQYEKREPFIQSYFLKYSNPELPAIWMVAEVLPLGTWSMIFANLIDRQDQKNICSHFNLSYKVMTSWLHCLNYLRNLCAHHSKLWNRSFTLKPLVANDYKDQFKNNSRFSAQAAILKIFLNIISPGNSWSNQLEALIEDHAVINIRRMGFYEGWKKSHFWRA